MSYWTVRDESEAAATMSQSDMCQEVAAKCVAALGSSVVELPVPPVDRYDAAPGAVTWMVPGPAVDRAIVCFRRPDELLVTVGFELIDVELDEIEGRH